MKILFILFFLCTALQGWSQMYRHEQLPVSFFKANRDRLRQEMPENSVAIFFANTKKCHSNDIYHRFHQDPNFYYLTGSREQDALLIVLKSRIKLDSIWTNELIYVLDNNQTDEIWDGKRIGVEGYKNYLKFEHVFVNSELENLNISFDQFDEVLISLPDENPIDDAAEKGDMASMLKHFNLKLAKDSIESKSFALMEIMSKLRQQKNLNEIELLKKSCEIAADAQIELMKSFEYGKTESEAQAIIQFVFLKEGAESEAFPVICGAGNNACVLHYSENTGIPKENDLMLVDLGVVYNGYCSDMTRTFPVNGKFNAYQKSIYEIVLRAEKAAISKCVPGEKFAAPHDRAVQVIAQGLMKLGIIKEYKDVYRYYMHGTNHYVGLDVHDAGLFAEFKVNQVIAIEPGIYIPYGSNCDKKWWGIGIRIEDNLLIQNGMPLNLTEKAPREVAEIEALMEQNSTLFK